MTNILREHSAIRPVTQQELDMKLAGIELKFDFLRNQLRTNVCQAILVLQKQSHPTKKLRRNLNKNATKILLQWFHDHIEDPYPTDQEKAMLAAQCVLTLKQINNWFGNTRIRYKRKCLKQAGKESKVVCS